MKVLPITSRKTLELCKNPPSFEFGDTLFICSYPKSGTTWTQNIVYQILSTKYAYVNTEVKLEHISLYSPFYENDATWNDGLVSDTYTQNHIKLGMRVFNTHLLWNMLPQGPQYKYIYLYREGKDVACSFYHHLSNQQSDGEYKGSFKDFLRLWLSGAMPYGRWIDHLKSYQFSNIINDERSNSNGDTNPITYNNSNNNKSSQPNIVYIKYEDMIDNLSFIVDRIDCFLNPQTSSQPISSQSSPSFNQNEQKQRRGLCCYDSIKDKISFDYMKTNIDQFQPRSVQWHTGFTFIRQGKVGSYFELFDEDDVKLYDGAIDKDTLIFFESNLP